MLPDWVVPALLALGFLVLWLVVFPRVGIQT